MRTWAGVLVAIAFVAALVIALQRESSVECTVCIEFSGGSACRTAAGSARDATVRGATASACSVLSSGVTGGLECDRTPPRSVQCTE